LVFYEGVMNERFVAVSTVTGSRIGLHGGLLSKCLISYCRIGRFEECTS